MASRERGCDPLGWAAATDPAPAGEPALPHRETGTSPSWELLQSPKKMFWFIKASIFKLEVFPNNNGKIFTNFFFF